MDEKLRYLYVTELSCISRSSETDCHLSHRTRTRGEKKRTGIRCTFFIILKFFYQIILHSEPCRFSGFPVRPWCGLCPLKIQTLASQVYCRRRPCDHVSHLCLVDYHLLHAGGGGGVRPEGGAPGVPQGLVRLPVFLPRLHTPGTDALYSRKKSLADVLGNPAMVFTLTIL